LSLVFGCDDVKAWNTPGRSSHRGVIDCLERFCDVARVNFGDTRCSKNKGRVRRVVDVPA